MFTTKIKNIRDIKAPTPLEFQRAVSKMHARGTYFGPDGRCYKLWTQSSPLINGVRHHWFKGQLVPREKRA